MACDTQVVRILDNGDVQPKEPITLKKGQGHRILWISNSNKAWEIRFKDERTPFEKNTLQVAAFGWAESGEIKKDAIPEGKAEERYTYDTRHASAGQVAADPDVIVQN